MHSAATAQLRRNGATLTAPCFKGSRLDPVLLKVSVMQRALRNVPIAPKIFCAVAVILTTAIILATLAFWNFAAMNAATKEVEASGDRVEASGRATANLLSYARAIEFLPSRCPWRSAQASKAQPMMSCVACRNRSISLNRPPAQPQDGPMCSRCEPCSLSIRSKRQRSDSYRGTAHMTTPARSLSPLLTVIGQIRDVMRGLEQRAQARRHEAVKEASAAYSRATWVMTALSWPAAFSVFPHRVYCDRLHHASAFCNDRGHA